MKYFRALERSNTYKHELGTATNTDEEKTYSLV